MSAPPKLSARALVLAFALEVIVLGFVATLALRGLISGERALVAAGFLVVARMRPPAPPSSGGLPPAGLVAWLFVVGITIGRGLAALARSRSVLVTMLALAVWAGAACGMAACLERQDLAAAGAVAAPMAGDFIKKKCLERLPDGWRWICDLEPAAVDLLLAKLRGAAPQSVAIWVEAPAVTLEEKQLELARLLGAPIGGGL